MEALRSHRYISAKVEQLNTTDKLSRHMGRRFYANIFHREHKSLLGRGAGLLLELGDHGVDVRVPGHHHPHLPLDAPNRHPRGRNLNKDLFIPSDLFLLGNILEY